MLCGSLDGRGVWGRMNTYWLSPFAVPLKLSQTVLVGYTPVQNKNVFLKEYFLGEDIKYQQIQNFACFPFKYLAPFLFSYEFFYFLGNVINPPVCQSEYVSRMETPVVSKGLVNSNDQSRQAPVPSWV